MAEPRLADLATPKTKNTPCVCMMKPPPISPSFRNTFPCVMWSFFQSASRTAKTLPSCHMNSFGKAKSHSLLWEQPPHTTNKALFIRFTLPQGKAFLMRINAVERFAVIPWRMLPPLPRIAYRASSAPLFVSFPFCSGLTDCHHADRLRSHVE